MLSKPTVDVLKRIEKYFNRRGYRKWKVKKHPEAVLLAILWEIEKNMKEVSAMLYSTVDMGFFDDYIEKAQELLDEENKNK